MVTKDAILSEIGRGVIFGADEIAERLSAFSQAINVKSPPFNAIGDGVTSDATAFQSAYDAAATNSVIDIPAGNYSGVSVTTASKPVFWESEGLNAAGSSPLSLPYTSLHRYGRRYYLNQTNNDGTEYSAFQIQRTASYTGGTPGYVNSALVVKTTVSSGVANFEWAVLGIVENSATGGENVAIYGQGKRMTSSTGATWAGVLEVRDESGAADPTTGLIGLEIDVFANGTDTSGNRNRIGLDIVVGKSDTGGTKCYIGHGIRISPFGLDAAVAEVYKAVNIDIDATFGIFSNNTIAVGIDFSGATISTAALRIARGQKIAWEATSSIYSALRSGSNIIDFVYGAAKFGFDFTNNALLINDTAVVKPRKTGWTVATGTATRTAFDTATVTLSQLAERVKALIDDLHSTAGHGLIGA